MSNSTPDTNKEPLLRRIWQSIQRDPLPPADDRGRMRVVMNNLILHLHPAKVAKPTLKFTYTFGLGGLLMLLTGILGVTGVLLMFAYTPSPDEAYNSMIALQTEVRFGNLIRNLHHWSANLMVVVSVLHLLRVFFTGGFRSPREFNWQLGLAMLLIVIGSNFTGYLLPWDQLAYWAITVGTSLLSYIPLIGDAVSQLILGGPEVGAPTLINFYGLHVAVLPMLLLGIMSFHIWRVRKDTMTIPRKAGEEETKRVEKVTTIPNLVSREFIFAVIMLALIVTFSAFVNAPLEEAANPNHSPNPAKAAWYFMGLQELLLHFHPVFGAIIIPGIGLATLVALPYLEGDMSAAGIWFRSKRGRWLAVVGVLIGVIWTIALVLADETWLDLPAMMPFFPTIISNGWIPMAVLLLGLIGYSEIIKLFGATDCEIRLSLFTLLLAAFITLTIIGIFFRGEGMMLIIPWKVLG